MPQAGTEEGAQKKGHGADVPAVACVRHPEVKAAWFCKHCESLLCETCPHIKEVRGVDMETCVVCGKSLRLVRLSDEQQDPQLFERLCRESPRYPIQGHGTAILGWSVPLSLFVFFTRDIMLADVFFSGAATLFLMAYGAKVLKASIDGDALPPDWPDPLRGYDAIVLPAGYLLLASIFTLAPWVVLWIWPPSGSLIPAFLAFVVGAALWPMALLAMCLYQSFDALNPMFLVRSITRVPREYARTVGVSTGILIAQVFILNLLLECPLLVFLLAMPAFLYLLMVQLRVVGLLYYANRKKLGWFTE